MNLNVFARLLKYDEKTGYFEAMAADETLDKSQEIFDYDISKPHFLKWSQEFEKSTDGKSKGNVRAMHGKIAAGKLTDIEFRDAEKGIFVKGLVVDPVEKTKMASGLYTGLSIGGSYGKKWEDPVMKGVIRYEAIPSEISIVDNPCNPGAMFTMVKADGAEVQKHFDANIAEQLIGQVWKCAVKGHEHDKKAEAESCTAITTESLRKGVMVADVRPEFAASIGVDLAKLAPAADAQTEEQKAAAEAIANGQKTAEQLDVEKNLDPRVKDFDPEQMAAFEKFLPDIKTREALTMIVGKIAARQYDTGTPGEVEKGSTTYADPINKKYPIDSAAHIRAAWNYIHKSKNAAKYSADDVTAMKSKIVSAWKEKIDKAGPPSASDDAADKSVATLALCKGMYSVSQLAGYVESINWLLEGYQYEQTMEGDESEACTMLEDALHMLCRALAAMAKEETDELMGNADMMALAASITDMAKALKVEDLDGEPMFLAPAAWDKVMKDAAFARIKAAEAPKRAELAKSLGMTLGKVGARHSKGDKAHLQAIHDHSIGMGAECDHSDCGDDAEKAARAGRLTKLATVEKELGETKELRSHLAKQVVAIAKALELPGQSDASDIVEPVNKMIAELKKLKALPAPAKGNLIDVGTLNDADPIRIGKTDAPAEDKPILKHDGSVDQEAQATRAIRKLHGFRT